MIPEFPESREVTLQDKPLFDKLFAAHPPEISAYTFTNIFAWRTTRGTRISQLNKWILVLHSCGDHKVCLQPLGDGPIAPIVEEILQRSELVQAFERISSEAANELHDLPVIIQSDRDNWDYLYLAEDLINLPGRKYDGKRNFITRAKATLDYEYIELDGKLAMECEDFAEEWCDEKQCDTVEGLRKESCAVYMMLSNFDSLGIVGGAIRASGKIVAFSLGEPLNPNTFVIHVEKADSRMSGLYQLINNEFCRGEALARKPGESQQADPQMLRPYKYVNREQDLGVPGLRLAKESYHPVRMIETFRIVRA